jgi:acetyl esterase/lipase
MKYKKFTYQTAVYSFICVGSLLNTNCVHKSQKELKIEKSKVAYRCTKDVVYTPEGWNQEVRGDFYKPKVSGKTPVVLLVHGGGWAENDNRYQMGGIARKLARQGFAVFNVTYRLAPKYHFPAPVDDLLESLKWLKQHDDSLNIDTQKTAIFGYSAGGHLAELAAMRKMPEGVKICAVVAGGTPHFVRVDPDFPLVRDFMGVSYAENPDIYHEATPVDQVTKDFPPVFIYHGTEDDLVPPLHVDHWQKRLTELGVEHEIYWVKGRGHIGTFLIPQGSVSQAIAFLRKKLLSS